MRETAIDKIMTNEDAAVFLNYTAKMKTKSGSTGYLFEKVTKATAYQYTEDNGYTYYAKDDIIAVHFEKLGMLSLFVLKLQKIRVSGD